MVLKDLVQRVLDRENTDGFEVALDIEESLTGIADARLLSRAIGNLVRNAVRYLYPLQGGQGDNG